MPPFLSWMPSDDELSKSGDTLMERLTLAESGIMRIPERPHRDDLIEEAYKAFHDTDVFFETQPKSFKDLEYRRKSLKGGGQETHAFPQGSRFAAGGDGNMMVLVEEMFDLSARVFEAFAPKELQAPSVSRCFGALSRVLQVSGVVTRKEAASSFARADESLRTQPPLQPCSTGTTLKSQTPIQIMLRLTAARRHG